MLPGGQPKPPKGGIDHERPENPGYAYIIYHRDQEGNHFLWLHEAGCKLYESVCKEEEGAQGPGEVCGRLTVQVAFRTFVYGRPPPQKKTHRRPSGMARPPQSSNPELHCQEPLALPVELRPHSLAPHAVWRVGPVGRSHRPSA